MEVLATATDTVDALLKRLDHHELALAGARRGGEATAGGRKIPPLRTGQRRSYLPSIVDALELIASIAATNAPAAPRLLSAIVSFSRCCIAPPPPPNAPTITTKPPQIKGFEHTVPALAAFLLSKNFRRAVAS